MRLADVDYLKYRLVIEKEKIEFTYDKNDEYVKCIDSVCEIIDKLHTISIADAASAQPQRWIPCSERLPEEKGCYLVTGRQGVVNKRRYEDGRWYGNWSVVAWMPLPQPYKGG